MHSLFATTLITLLGSFVFAAPHPSPRHTVLSTRSEHGQTIDWVRLNSQVSGPIAQPPPSMNADTHDQDPTLVTSASLGDDAPSSPQDFNGLVPIARGGTNLVQKVPPPNLRAHSSTDTAATNAISDSTTTSPSRRNDYDLQAALNSRWYGSVLTPQGAYHGNCASYSMYSPYVAPTDFSLVQSTLIHGRHTIEAGWQTYPEMTGHNRPALFVYYTTGLYEADGDYIGGYNREHLGWVQTNRRIFPGQTWTGGTVANDRTKLWGLELRWELFESNWWLSVNDIAIGYYPGSLFSSSSPDQANETTLAHHAERVSWYGEIYDSTVDRTSRTDMGNGMNPNHAGANWTNTAFIRNMLLKGHNGVWTRMNSYDGFVDDPQRYGMLLFYGDKDPVWGSFALLGGAGEGGVIGA